MTPTTPSDSDGTKPEATTPADSKGSSGQDAIDTPPASRPPSMSARQKLPPPFQPAGLPPSMAGIQDTNGFQPQQPLHMANGHPHSHSAHPSLGTIPLGFHSSAGSSPAPPLSGGGIAPAPGMPMPDARQPYMPPTPTAAGYPPTMPPGLDGMMGVDVYGRPNMGYPPHMDPYQQQYGNTFPPSTPHNFHDSQSPVPDDGGSFHQYAASRNDLPQFGEDARHPGAMGHQQGPPGMGPPPPGGGDDASGLMEHIQQQFGTHELADCTLELRHPDARVAPIRIPGHRIVLSRSPVLGELMRNQAQSQQQQPGPLTLSVEAQDDWIRADAFYMACQRLYGLPLLDVPPRMDMDGGSGTVTAAGSVLDRFNFALSYASAGHLLGWGPVVRRGCEIAAQLVSLETVEAAMAFALSRHEDRGSHDNLRYGDGSRVLLGAVLGFVASKLSPSFQLDPTVSQQGGLGGYSRLPYDTPSPPKTATEKQQQQTPSSPVVVRANHPAHKKSQASRSTSQAPPHIQFGDLSLTNGAAGSAAADSTPRPSAPTQTALRTVLSRVLINLPFHSLKMLLESPGMHGWAGVETRLSVVLETTREREARRARAIEAVTSGRIPDTRAVLAALGSPEPTAHAGAWTLLAWQEEVSWPGGTDGPCLGRRWVPLKMEGQGQGAGQGARAYP